MRPSATEPTNRFRHAEARPSRTTGLIRALGILTLIGLALSLAGCARKSSAICPRAAILAQTASLVHFVPGSEPKAANIAFEARMSNLKVDCQYFGELGTEMGNNISVDIEVLRGPRLKDVVIRLHYFVTVTDRRGAILSKRRFPVKLDFRKGRQRLRLVEESWQYFDLRHGTTGLSYEIWTGFQLTNEQVEYNRSQQAK